MRSNTALSMEAKIGAESVTVMAERYGSIIVPVARARSKEQRARIRL